MTGYSNKGMSDGGFLELWYQHRRPWHLRHPVGSGVDFHFRFLKDPDFHVRVHLGACIPDEADNGEPALLSDFQSLIGDGSLGSDKGNTGTADLGDHFRSHAPGGDHEGLGAIDVV